MCRLALVYSVAEDDIELLMFQPLYPTRQDYRCVKAHFQLYLFLKNKQIS